jgi:hypothetical protein
MSRIEFTATTKQLALVRQRHRCGSCGERVAQLGEAGRSHHRYGEVAHAHHVRHAKFGGRNTLGNCVILCASCHFLVHEGGNYRYGTVVGRLEDFLHFSG